MPGTSRGPDWTGGFYVDMARALERACFDYMILEDTCMVSDAYGGSFAPSLKHAVFAPKHDQRYDVADEYVDLVCRLWDSWEPDTVVMDRDTGVYADGSKVHTIDFEGRYFKSRGPLNTVRSPQGRPVFVQAGASPRGREFAAKYADSIIATATGIEGMKAYRDDMRARLVAHGRKPDDCKVLFLVSPILGDTGPEASQKRQAMISTSDDIEQILIGISSITEVDFSAFDLDAPLPEITTNGERGSLNKFAQWGSGKTLRQLAAEHVDRSIELVGTPDQVADRMTEVMEAVGGDGFLITRPGQTGLTRKYIIEITDGLIPALQRRGLTRTHYTHAHFRDTLLEF